MTNHYILQCTMHKDYFTVRTPHRANHFELVKAFKETGELLMGGAIDDGTEAYIIFNCTEERISYFVVHDPYVMNAVAVSYQLKKRAMVTGEVKAVSKTVVTPS